MRRPEITGFISVAPPANMYDFSFLAPCPSSGLIINGGGFSHTSVAILDALLTIEIPKIEIHLSNLFRREDFRHHSYISKGVHGVICGFGPNSYVLAVEGMVKLI